MKFYSQKLFPRLMDWAMRGERFTQYRERALAAARGRVLEVGCGSCRNLPHYPAEVASLVVTDPNPGMFALARANQVGARFPLHNLVCSAERVPLASTAFDFVVSTWTLCSVENPQSVLEEVCRVLRVGGKFLFAEHGLSPEPDVQKWQNRLDPLQRVIGDGCHLTRDILGLLRQSGLEIEQVDQFYAPKTPRWAGYTTLGVAVRTE